MTIDQIDKRIKAAVAEKGMTIKTLCSKIGLTEQGYQYAIKNGSFKIVTLIAISEELNKNIEYFISSEEEIKDYQNQVTAIHKYLDDAAKYLTSLLPKEERGKFSEEEIYNAIKTRIYSKGLALTFAEFKELLPEVKGAYKKKTKRK
ncbi:MAG: helix-turn-helix transcriptional regulator [Bacteroidia bacterium]